MARLASITLALALCGLARAAVPSNCTAQDGDCAVDDSPVNLLQVTTMTKSGTERATANSLVAASEEAAATCSPLGNHGSWFSIKVGIGTPAQYFDLVADTGSNALIVADCKCVYEGGGCSPKYACFDSRKSKSFAPDVVVTPELTVGVKKGLMSYGSGTVAIKTGSDEVVVGGIQTYMKNGVDSIYNRQALRVGPDFEGILGLGLPHSIIKAKLFTLTAGIQRFSVCLGNKGGALRFNAPPGPNPMNQIATVHWGLDFRGMSVGGASQKVLFCRREDMNPGQQTPCGGIPDSGTTLLMGPKDQILGLYDTLCANWPRCMEQSLATGQSLSMSFHQTLMKCELWLPQGKGLKELPSIFFHYAGSEGVVQTLEVSPEVYIHETTRELFEVITGRLFGLRVKDMIPLGKKKICVASFAPNQYNTLLNGPVWILGQPLFYAATVTYDNSANNGKGSIAIQRGKCTRCAAEFESKVGSKAAVKAEEAEPELRHIAEIREPHYEASDPL